MRLTPLIVKHIICENGLITYLNVVVHEPACISKIRVLGVDVGQLNGNQVVDLKRRENKPVKIERG